MPDPPPKGTAQRRRPELPPHDPELGPRLERFRAALRAAGGPVETLEQGRSGLDALWGWFVETHPARPGLRLADEAKLRGGGPLPIWYARNDFLGRRLGPELLQLADGLAAHVTSILMATAADADWVIEKDAYIKGNVPKLRLPGRRPGPIDEQIASFVLFMHEEPAFYLPKNPMTFVDAFIEYGDPRTQSYGQQTAKEAGELLESITSGHDAQVATLLEAVGARGGPRAKLDFSVESLVPLWTWLSSLPLPPAPIPDREMRRNVPPFWYFFSGRMIGQVLGPDLCWLANGTTHYAAEVVFRLLPGSAWVLGSDRRGDFREPLLCFGTTVELAIHDRVPRRLANDAVARMPHMAGQRVNPIGPNDLRSMVEQYLGHARRPAPAEPEPKPAYVVELVAPKPSSLGARMRRRMGLGGGDDTVKAEYSAEITFSDEVAHRESGRVDRFVRALAGSQGVDRAFREDRELVYVIAPGLRSEELSALIAGAWSDAATKPTAAGQG